MVQNVGLATSSLTGRIVPRQTCRGVSGLVGETEGLRLAHSPDAFWFKSFHGLVSILMRS